MCFEIAVGGADVMALWACGRVYNFDVLLHLDIRRETDGVVESNRVQSGINFSHFWRADLAPKTIAAVLTVLVSDQMRRGLETCDTGFAGEAVHFVTSVWFLVEVNKLYVPIKSLLFAEVLVAGRVTGTEVIGLAVLMCLLVLLQSLSCMEALGALRPIADVVADIVMLCLNVVLQVALAQKRLAAALLGTREGSIVGVRAFMFLQSDRARVGFFATLKIADVFILSRHG